MKGEDSSHFTLAGIVSGVEMRISKKRRQPWIKVYLRTGSGEVSVRWPDTFVPVSGAEVIVEGVIRGDGNGFPLLTAKTFTHRGDPESISPVERGRR